MKNNRKAASGLQRVSNSNTSLVLMALRDIKTSPTHSFSILQQKELCGKTGCRWNSGENYFSFRANKVHIPYTTNPIELFCLPSCSSSTRSRKEGHLEMRTAKIMLLTWCHARLWLDPFSEKKDHKLLVPINKARHYWARKRRSIKLLSLSKGMAKVRLFSLFMSSVVTSNLHETTLRCFEKISFKVY